MSYPSLARDITLCGPEISANIRNSHFRRSERAGDTAIWAKRKAVLGFCLIMEINEALDRVAKVLAMLRAREHGRLEQLAAAIGKRRGYVTKLHKTDNYSFARLLAVIGAFGAERGSFVARALDIYPAPDTYLLALQRPR